jgi:hypothetical protein
MNNPDLFLNQRKLVIDEVLRYSELAQRYRNEMPIIQVNWDLTPGSVRHNNIDSSIISNGITIYNCSNDALWDGLFEPSPYGGDTIWSKKHGHSEWKIARVIEAWERGQSLSPLFLMGHQRLRLGLVCDGKHRLTVSRAINAENVPFMVSSLDRAWVETAIPGAVQICQIAPLLPEDILGQAEDSPRAHFEG